MEPYVTAIEVAKHFAVQPSTVMDWRKTLGMPSHRFGTGRRGGTVLFKLSEVTIWAQRFKEKSR